MQGMGTPDCLGSVLGIQIGAKNKQREEMTKRIKEIKFEIKTRSCLTNPFRNPKKIPRTKETFALVPVSNAKAKVSPIVAVLSLVLGTFFLEPSVFIDALSTAPASMSFSVSSMLDDTTSDLHFA